MPGLLGGVMRLGVEAETGDHGHTPECMKAHKSASGPSIE